jgi:hypothetical protein
VRVGLAIPLGEAKEQGSGPSREMSHPTGASEIY